MSISGRLERLLIGNQERKRFDFECASAMAKLNGIFELENGGEASSAGRFPHSFAAPLFLKFFLYKLGGRSYPRFIKAILYEVGTDFSFPWRRQVRLPETKLPLSPGRSCRRPARPGGGDPFRAVAGILVGAFWLAR